MSKQKKSITSIKTKILTAVSALVLILVLILILLSYMISKNIIEDIKGYLKFGCTVLGVNNNKIKVIDNHKK